MFDSATTSAAPNTDLFQFWMHPRHWANKSDDLWRSAEIIWSNYGQAHRGAKTPDQYWDLHSSACIALMLIGLSIENSMKGILIAEKMSSKGANFESDSEEEFGNIVNKKHRLSSLWDDVSDICGFHNDTDYKNKLNRVSDYILWYARYPLPTKRSKFEDFRNRTHGGKIYEVDILLRWSFDNYTLLKITLDNMINKLENSETAIQS